MPLHPETYHKIVAAKNFIDINFQEALRLEDLAGEACMSPFHFHRIFSQIYLQTPLTYVTRRRLLKAKEMLLENVQVQEICARLGYASAGSFSHLFKKEFGQTPTAFREQIQKRSRDIVSEPRIAIPGCFSMMNLVPSK